MSIYFRGIKEYDIWISKVETEAYEFENRKDAQLMCDLLNVISICGMNGRPRWELSPHGTAEWQMTYIFTNDKMKLHSEKSKPFKGHPEL